jgi:hypothetical protein
MAIKLKEINAILVRSYLAGTNLFMRSKPGIGKTMTIEAWAAEMKKRVEGFELHRFYCPTMSPMDIQASAPDYETGLLRLFNNEALPNAYKNPNMVGAVFFGELPNADPTTAKLLQKYINGEDMSGVLRKPDGVIVIADGNRLEDKSSVQQQGRAFLNRFAQVEVFTDANDNMEYASKHDWHPHVQAFFQENASLIDNYDEVFEIGNQHKKEGGKTSARDSTMSEEGRLGIWANMRSWERISKLEYAAEKTGTTVSLQEAIGNVGTGVGTAYHTFKEMFGRLAKFEDIMADPEKVKIPTAMDEQYAMAILVAVRCSTEQLPKVMAFGKRLPYELQAALLRHLTYRKAVNLVSSPVFNEWMSDPQMVSLLNAR